MNNPAEKVKCSTCGKRFCNIYTLRRHEKKIHSINLPAPLKYKSAANFTYTCNCGKNFTHKHHFSYHVKSHNAHNTFESGVKSKKCPLCDYSNSYRKKLNHHFQIEHDIVVTESSHQFISLGQFETYKIDIENKTNSRFVKEYTKSSTTCIIVSYICNRSGVYTPTSDNNRLRRLKTQGSNKINGFCPASMKLVIQSDGKCTLNFVETHIGHTNDIEHLSLTQLERKNLAEKIASKIPFNEILDEVRDSVTDSPLHRIHLLTKKDLYNLESSINLCSNSVRLPNDAISVESWVNDMSKGDDMCVLFYKPQESIIEEHPELKREDFLLIIMNQAQCDMLKKYGSDCVCLDSIHGINSYNFELVTLLIIDDMRQAFPCAFLITNRTDKDALKVFFSYVKKHTESILPKVFMSDIAESFYNAWLEVMGKPQLRLYCTWHVDQAWRKNLVKIKNKEKQVTVYKNLRTVMEERDASTFIVLIEEFCNKMLQDPETHDFAEYFNEYYTKNYESWAYCYRVHADINTNMHLERMNRTIKYIYLNGKNVKRLDKAIAGIMKFVRDKLFDRIIPFNKGKITSKLKAIRSRHKTSLKLDTSLVIPTESGWEIMSPSNNYELYLIQENNDNCTCQLICTDCNICLHRYLCSCPDSAIKWIMCKHIHLLCRYRSKEENNKVAERVERIDDDDKLYIDSDNKLKEEELEFIAAEVSKSKIVNYGNEESLVDNEKRKLQEQFLEILDNIQTMAEVEIIKKKIALISPALAALRKSSQQNRVIPHNKGIPQR